MIDETCGAAAIEERERIRKRGVRSAVMMALNIGNFWLPKNPVERISELGWILRYTLDGGFSTKARTPMDVNKLADQWIDAVVKMCLSHDKADYDAADAQADTLLRPILAAPIKQVREFYHLLLQKMRDEKRVPFLVWVSFEAWGEFAVKDAPDQGVKRLKAKLAADLAELVKEPVAEQLPKAIARALKWRDPEQLKEVKAAVEAGAKPKLVGRQSCLYLECPVPGKEPVSVMI
ncbi:MAG TPA: hypothetical protein VK797_23550 [Tepidisphaeraceae bacterium]|jgi:hypothetical protein|nr:hypothetical protein [Tepidisphaeraceae bacterium]